MQRGLGDGGQLAETALGGFKPFVGGEGDGFEVATQAGDVGFVLGVGALIEREHGLLILGPAGGPGLGEFVEPTVIVGGDDLEGGLQIGLRLLPQFGAELAEVHPGAVRRPTTVPAASRKQAATAQRNQVAADRAETGRAGTCQ